MGKMGGKKPHGWEYGGRGGIRVQRQKVKIVIKVFFHGGGGQRKGRGGTEKKPEMAGSEGNGRKIENTTPEVRGGENLQRSL